MRSHLGRFGGRGRRQLDGQSGKRRHLNFVNECRHCNGPYSLCNVLGFFRPRFPVAQVRPSHASARAVSLSLSCQINRLIRVRRRKQLDAHCLLPSAAE